MSGPFFNPHAPITIHTRTLPHWQQPGALVFLTWRLADSFPASLLECWKAERAAWLARNPRPWSSATELAYHREFTARNELGLDAGHGSCALRDPICSNFVEAALHHFDGKHYTLDSFVIMPNHVHLIVRLFPEHSLPEIVKSWKSFSARKINPLVDITGPLWQEGYWDRLVRDGPHLFRCRDYIRRNPEKARLAPSAFRLHIDDVLYGGDGPGGPSSDLNP